MRTYARRSEADAFYKDAKQNLGMEEYELRKISGIKRHLQMILTAHTLLSLGSADRAAGKAMVYLETIGAACRRRNSSLPYPSRVGDREAGERPRQNPEGAFLVEEAAREKKRKCKSLIGGLKG